MSGQNEDQTSRRKFLKGAGLVGAATVATPAAANTVPSQSEWSPEQISKLEEIVKNFITNAQASNIQPLDSCARLMGHGSHNNEGSRARAAPATRTAPTRTPPGPSESWIGYPRLFAFHGAVPETAAGVAPESVRRLRSWPRICSDHVRLNPPATAIA